MRRAAQICAFAILIAGAALAIRSALQHDSARAAWRSEAARLGHPDYDAARSDARYAEAMDALKLARSGGWIFAIGAIGAGLALARARAHAGRPAWRRAPIATLIDAVILAIAIAAIAACSMAGPELAAWTAIGARAIAGGAIALPWALLVAGATPGMRAVGLRAEQSSVARAALALALLPVAIAIAPLSLALLASRSERAVLLAPHLRAAGLVPTHGRGTAF